MGFFISANKIILDSTLNIFHDFLLSNKKLVHVNDHIPRQDAG